MSSAPTCVQDALAIWRAGVEAVRADRVVAQGLHWDGRWLVIDGDRYDLKGIQRLLVIGAGKATYGMLVGLHAALHRHPVPVPQLVGRIHVPEGTVSAAPVPYAGPIEVDEVRPQGINEPTPLVVDGTREIVRLVELADASTCVLCLISGGGSALMALPPPWLSLAKKIEITRRLSATGATIQELNEVRRCLSEVKGGGLARRCRARRMIGLIVSDVLGDPLPSIASGPTVLEPRPDPRRARAILQSFCPGEFEDVLKRLASSSTSDEPRPSERGSEAACQVSHHVLANNAMAVDAAGTCAVGLGYRYWMESSIHGDGPVEDFAQRFARQWMELTADSSIDCMISGGEPTVVLPDPSVRGRGGRNQQMILIAGRWLVEHAPQGFDFALVSGGTDGEDGPTDAAGAWIDREWVERCRREGWDLTESIRRCDAYSFLARTGNVLITGPTQTNVCDLRVGLVKKSTRMRQDASSSDA